MSLKKFLHARVLAFAAVLLLGLTLSGPTFHAAYAQAPATDTAAPPAAAAPAPAAAPPACDAKTLEKCSPNSGDTAWMLTSMAIVLMMTIPGLALFYGGMVRKKNVGDTVMTSFAITCLISILWLLFTYSLAFREGGEVFGYDMGWFIGGFDRAGLQGIVSDIAKNVGNPNTLAPTIPETVYSMFQLTFAIITAALIFGSTAERMKFSAMLWFTGLWAVFVYSPIAHWVWGPDGMFNSSNPHSFINVLDFAGGTVVHVNSGTAGLMCALMLGKRKDTGPAHNMVLTLIGASLLWVGWFGFNAGSAVTAGLQAGMAMLVTHTATATAGFTWMLIEWFLKGKPTVIGVCSGAVAGLVAITPASGFVGPMGSFWIGIAAGIICYWGCTGLKHTFGYDDALDTFGVHGVGGAAGALLTGVFAVNEYGGTPGLLEGNAMQVVYQAIGVGTVFIYDVVVTLILLKIIDMVIGLRVSPEVEQEGLDIALHGEAIQ
jgi:ammonium transporter, Amt family